MSAPSPLSAPPSAFLPPAPPPVSHIDPDPALVARLRAAGCVFAEDEARLLQATADTPQDLDSMAARRTAGHPLEQVLGWAEFCGLRIAVDPGVFVPRRRTEFLIRQAAVLAGPRPLVLLDLCCGTGALAAALAALTGEAETPARTRPEIHAADLDPAAVRCARTNLAPLGGHVYQGDLYAPLPGTLRGRITVLLANTPYVPTAYIPLLPPEARDHEPRTALDGGADGLDLQRRVLADAARWLAPGGSLLTETSPSQAPQLLAAAARAGLAARLAEDEDWDATVVIATRPATPTEPHR
jgi:release factor glutamine methyltransferase